MKIGLSVKMTDQEDHNKANFYIYQKLVETLMYLSYGIRPDVAFAVR